MRKTVMPMVAALILGVVALAAGEKSSKEMKDFGFQVCGAATDHLDQPFCASAEHFFRKDNPEPCGVDARAQYKVRMAEAICVTGKRRNDGFSSACWKTAIRVLTGVDLDSKDPDKKAKPNLLDAEQGLLAAGRKCLERDAQTGVPCMEEQVTLLKATFAASGPEAATGLGCKVETGAANNETKEMLQPVGTPVTTPAVPGSDTGARPGE